MKYKIMAVHAEPYAVREEAFPETNLMWDRSAGRITIRYCTSNAHQINDVSVLLATVPEELLGELADALDKIVKNSLEQVTPMDEVGLNVNFLSDVGVKGV